MSNQLNLIELKLTAREKEVLALLAEGNTAKDVADALFISKRTVDFHTSAIYDKVSDALPYGESKRKVGFAVAYARKVGAL